LTEAAIGEVMRLPDEIVARIGREQHFPRYLGRDLRLTYNDALLVRKHTLDVLKLVDLAAKDQSVKLRLLLSGSTGIGKSATLLQTVCHCLSTNQWLVLYVPNAIDWVDGRYPYAPVVEGSKDAYSQDALTQKVLAHFKQMNAEKLKTLTTSRAHKLGGVELAKGTTMAQLLDRGIASQQVATDTWFALMDELCALTETPVLIAVDGVNAFYAPADYHHPDSTRLMPNQLQLIKPLYALLEGQRTLTSGLIIGAPSYQDVRFGKQLPSTEGNSKLVRVSVPELDIKETLALMDYYYRAQVIFQGKYIHR
jgi:hypothetical protein